MFSSMCVPLFQSSRRVLSTTMVGTVRRSLSTSTKIKSYPQYNIFDAKCILSIRLIPPLFRYLQNTNTLALENNKKGRLLFEWVPRNSSNGAILRETVVRVGLTPEEVGLLLNQIPQHQPVEFLRKPAPNESLHEGPSAPRKVCKVLPDPTLGSVDWVVDFEVDGVGGKGQGGITGPLSVSAQAGEMQVLLEIMRSALPHMVGWTTLQDISMQKVVNTAMNGDGGRDDPSYF